MMEITVSDLSIRAKCSLLLVPRSTLYYQPQPKRNNSCLQNEIKTLWLKYPFYGYRRIHAQLCREGHLINEKRVKRLMRSMNLRGMAPGPMTSRGEKKDEKWPYLLKGLRIERINQVWATDITYLRIPQGFVYLVALIDLYSRYMIHYTVSVTMDAEFCVRMTQEAFLKAKPEIFHSDQGSQFTCEQMNSVLLLSQVKGSMTGKGRCLDNVYIERFWRSFEFEDLYLRDYASVREARESVEKYMTFYNEERLHQHLQYQTPKEVYFQQNPIPVAGFVYQERTKGKMKREKENKQKETK